MTAKRRPPGRAAPDAPADGKPRLGAAGNEAIRTTRQQCRRLPRC
jgi:hypothetical protein